MSSASEEKYLLRSFWNWSWPRPSAKALARAGFFYTGQDQVVYCQLCKITVFSWEPNDDPVKEHRLRSPLCPFFQDRNTTTESGPSESNAPTSATTVSEEQRRLQTFAGWPRPQPSTKALARAGFVYTGQGDHVRCQICKLTLLNWEPSDDPVKEHRLRSPLCPFFQDRNTTTECGPSESNAPTSATTVNEEQRHQSFFGWSRSRHSAALRKMFTRKIRDLHTTVKQRREQRRLQTFVGWPLPRPSAEAMARAGFVYTGEGDGVRCQFCKVTVFSWEPNVDPVEEHRRHSPRCSFLQGLNTNAQYNTSESEAHALATILSEEEHRLQTFAGWPRPRPSAEAMARAGFFYTGEGDGVRCQFCKVTVFNWEPNVDPVEEHRRHSPRCSFLQGLDTNAQCNTSESEAHALATILSEEEHRLQSFFGWPLSRPSAEAMTLAGFVYTGQDDRVNCNFCPLTLNNWKPNDDPLEEHRRHNPLCSFLQGLDATAESSPSESDAPTPATNAESGQAATAQDGSELSEEPALSHTSSELNEEPALSHTASDNRHLRDEKLCKICLENEARTVFLPCSHLATCPVCAAEIHVCCICRRPIERKIDVFLA